MTSDAERLGTIEACIAHQDRTIEELNTVVTQQWTTIEHLRRRLDAMEEQVRSGGYIADPSMEKPPPHY